MRKFEISTDSTCDLYKEELAKYEVNIARLNYTMSKNDDIEEYLDDFNSYDEYVEFYSKLRNGYIAKTSILNLQAHIDLFTDMAKRGIKKALHITQSYGLSPTLDNANKAIETVKQEFPDIDYIAIESNTSTIGEGDMVEIAVDMRDKGKTAEETAEYINTVKGNLQHFVVVDDLMFLKRGGRISGASAIIGSMLNIKPVIEFTKQGKLEVVKKEMGMMKAFKNIVANSKNFTINKDYPCVKIVHTDNMPMAEKLKNLVKQELGLDAEIRIMGPIVGAHVGPNAVAFSFLANEERKY